MFIFTKEESFIINMYEELTIKGKAIFICEKHHHVLKFWHQFKNRHPYLLTFDHHTDLHRAFQHSINSEYPLYKNRGRTAEDWNKDQAELLQGISKNDLETILKLKHDEHIDAAIFSGIIKKALVYSYDSYGDKPNRVYVIYGDREYNDEPIINNPILNRDAISPIESAELSEGFQRFELCIPKSKWFDNYILDIDLDFFHTCKSINPADITFFKEIIDNSIAISIAKETTFINRWAEDYDKNLSVDYLLEKLFELIEK